jgi:hypothetical protein
MTARIRISGGAPIQVRAGAITKSSTYTAVVSRSSKVGRVSGLLNAVLVCIMVENLNLAGLSRE